MDQQLKLSRLYVPNRQYEKGACTECELFCGLSMPYNENNPHWHNHYELEITLLGVGTEIINSSMHTMRRGEAHIIYPADTHTYSTEKNVKFCFIQFEKKHISDDVYRKLEEIKNDPVVYFSEEACKVIENIYFAMDAVNQNLEMNDPTSIKIKEKLLDTALTLFFSFSDERSYHNSNIYSSLPIQKIIHYILENYQLPISTESVAKQFNYNTAYFRRFFRNSMGMSPKDYINSLRLKHAAKILMTTDLRIAEVCFNCGYTSMASFQRNFKSQYNMTPLEFKSKYTR